MSISLKDVDDRIKVLENKAATSGGIVESKIADPGYIKFANGLIMQWANKTHTFCIPFPTKCIIVFPLSRDGYRDDEQAWNSDMAPSGAPSNTGYSTFGQATKHLAIGYLITYRLLNIYYAHAYKIAHNCLHFLMRFLCLKQWEV